VNSWGVCPARWVDGGCDGSEMVSFDSNCLLLLSGLRPIVCSNTSAQQLFQIAPALVCGSRARSYLAKLPCTFAGVPPKRTFADHRLPSLYRLHKTRLTVRSKGYELSGQEYRRARAMYPLETAWGGRVRPR